MVWIGNKPFWFRSPYSFDEIVQRLAFERFEAGSKIISHEEGVRMFFYFLVACVVITAGLSLSMPVAPPCPALRV